VEDQPSNASRVCLITGAGRGIGRAVARQLSGAGHRVVITARSKDQLEAVAAGLPGESLVIPADLADPGAAEEIFATTEGTFGPVEVLVANAGVASSNPVVRVSDEEWQGIIDVNLTAPFRCIRRALPSMTAAGWGRIVVVASIASKRGDPYISAYTAAKHGVLGLVRAVAAEVVKKGVTVNAVCPAFVDTDMTDETVANISGRTGRDLSDARRIVENMQPIGRLITPDEVADVVSFFLGASGVTGQGWNVDGGAVQS
jgi:NAD(P)-dependent dehydrogenase (short-subunit alcohol dehydrogenase family)